MLLAAIAPRANAARSENAKSRTIVSPGGGPGGHMNGGFSAKGGNGTRGGSMNEIFGSDARFTGGGGGEGGSGSAGAVGVSGYGATVVFTTGSMVLVILENYAAGSPRRLPIFLSARVGICTAGVVRARA